MKRMGQSVFKSGTHRGSFCKPVFNWLTVTIVAVLNDTKFDCLSFCWSGFQIVFWEQNCFCSTCRLEVVCPPVSHAA